MEEKADLRIIKTRKALFDTFLELLQEESFDSITVNALCEKAMVRRATFYKHFADKYDFFAAFVRRVSEEFYAKSREQMQEERRLTTPLEYCYLMSVQFFGFLHEHEKSIKNVMESGAFYLLLDILTEEIYRSFYLELNDYAKEHPMPVPPAVAASFITGGLVQIGKKWAKNPSYKEVDGLLADIRVLLNSMCLF